MASATATTVTVTFDPNATSLQADIIAGATVNKAGVMTAAQVQALAAAIAGALPPAVVADITNIINIFNANGGAAIFNNTTRPPANDPSFLPALSAGRVVEIWNSDDLAPNYSDGLLWYDASGNET